MGTQGPPLLQVAQLPSWQTIPLPQLSPFGALPVSVHSGLPELQSIAPARQTFPSRVQLAPGTQPAHIPSRQTESAPQMVPFAWRLVVGSQRAWLPSQTVPPTTHGLPATAQGLSGMQVKTPPPAGASIGWLDPAPPPPLELV